MVPNSEVLATTDTKSFHKLTETEITILKIYCCMAAVMAFFQQPISDHIGRMYQTSSPDSDLRFFD